MPKSHFAVGDRVMVTIGYRQHRGTVREVNPSGCWMIEDTFSVQLDGGCEGPGKRVTVRGDRMIMA